MLQHATELGVVVNYDAEQFVIQPAIDTLVLDSMRKYNQSSARVLNTYQCYLKVSLNCSTWLTEWVEFSYVPTDTVYVIWEAGFTATRLTNTDKSKQFMKYTRLNKLKQLEKFCVDSEIRCDWSHPPPYHISASEGLIQTCLLHTSWPSFPC